MINDGIIRVLSLDAPRISRREIIRYAGGGRDEGDFALLLDDCLLEAMPCFTYKVCYGVFTPERKECCFDFGFANVKSRDLSVNLKECEDVVIFAATVGIGIDRLIMKYGRISPAKALIMQGIGAERIEALCDAFCRGLEEKGLLISPRFSPGYGDLPLEFQRDIFRTLDCSRKIGLTLSDSMLMSPTKSVTALVGLKKN